MRYEIRVRGRVSEAMRASFKGLETEIDPESTILRGSVNRSEELRSVLRKIEAAGLDLVEVKRVTQRG